MDALLFLSDEWIAAVDEALVRTVDDAAPDHEPGDGPTVIRYVIEHGPHGVSSYDLVFTADGHRARRPQGEASVTLRLDWSLATAINQGREGAQGAFLDGRIMISGDPQVLVRTADRLAEGNDRVAALRDRTVYGDVSPDTTAPPR